MQEVLIVRDLVKTFHLTKKQQQVEGVSTNRKTAVDHLSFSLHKGEMFGLLGTNGAGKTTALRMVSTLIKPDSGSISVLGLDALKDPAAVRGKLGFLTSELKLEDFFTPNYIFDYFSRLHGVPTDVAAQRKKLLFDQLGINHFAESKIGNLSTGMKQKTSIAVSLVHDPEIIIFDEPTNGLDIITAKAVTDFLLELKEQGKTIVISSHIFSLIEKTCDRVGIMIDGRMEYTNSLKTILAEGSLEDTFFRVYNDRKGEKRNG